MLWSLTSCFLFMMYFIFIFVSLKVMNKPVLFVLVLKKKKDKTCHLIDMIIPLDTNTSAKTTEKRTKYKDLEIEDERMWGLKTTTVSVSYGTIKIIYP